MKVGKLMVAAIAAAFSLGAWAGTEGKVKEGASAGMGSGTDVDAMFKSLDKDKDGFISLAEAKGSKLEKEFMKIDKNADGKLSREEHAAAPAQGGDKAAMGATPK